VVPPGDLEKWKPYEPFKPEKAEGKIIGRGTKDNGQQLIASLYGVSAALKAGTMSKNYNVKLLIVADEETGNKKGLEAIIDQLNFKKEDLFVVPDAGSEDGAQIEVSERSIRWYKFTVEGKQVHASLPSLGKNATLAAMYLGTALDERLHRTFADENKLYAAEPKSSFSITKVESNVENINTIPGKQVFCMDCRVNPEYKLEAIDTIIKEEAKVIEDRYGVKVNIEIPVDAPAAQPTSPDAPVVKIFEKALKLVYPEISPRIEGIGGGTFGGELRRRGYDVVVWGHGPEVDHTPQEFCYIRNLVNDAKVYAALVSIL
jgi:succinyl-diaminopimelate desuccinylase